MEREWSGNARRLSQADRREIERRLRAGETFEATAAAVGCSTKSILPSDTDRRHQATDQGTLTAARLARGARGDLVGLGVW